MSATVLVLAALGLLTALLLLLPVLRRPASPVEDADLAVYRDQLAELGRDLERGVLTAAEAGGARSEIERRMLRVVRRRSRQAPLGRGGRAVVIGCALLAPLVAGLIYAALGAPQLADQPFASRDRGAADEEMAQIRGMVEGLERRLAEQPEDAEGWLMLARSRAVLGDMPAAARAYREALARAPADPRALGGLGEALTAAAGGVVTPEARSLFERLEATGTLDPRAAYYQGLAELQAGDAHAAIARWRDLLAASPQDAPWRPAVSEALREAARDLGIDPETLLAEAPGQPPAAGSEAARIAALPAEERASEVRAMVERLDARLEEQGGEAGDWRRLGQARRVLGEIDKAREAYARAYAMSPQDATLVVEYAELLLGPQDPRTRLPVVGDDARELFERAAGLRPGDPQAHWYLGIRALQDGDVPGARAKWQQVLALLGPAHPDYPGIKELLDAIEQPEPPGGSAGG
jgi:cytochrome c-type biogenesis protein CcmH